MMRDQTGTADKHVGTSRNMGHKVTDRNQRRLGVIAGVIAASLVVVGAAVAATQVFSDGDVIPAGTRVGDARNDLGVDQVVLATGDSAIAGKWQLTSYESEASAGQPAGLPCVRLSLTEPPARTPLLSSGFCGETADGFGAASLPVTNGDDSEVLVFGLAPAPAKTIELIEASGPTHRREVSTAVGEDGRRSFVVGLQPTSDDGKLVWIDGRGAQGSRAVDASGFIDRYRGIQQLERD